MKLIYNFQKAPAEWKAPADTAFTLTNRKGGFLMLSQKPISRYFGWFIADENWQVFKVLENIELEGTSEITAIKNEAGGVARERKGLRERFIIPHQYDSFIYKLNKSAEINVFLDIKDAYDNPEFGRLYNFYEENGYMIVEFSQENKFSFYVVIKSDSTSYSRKDKWIKRHYRMDKERNSPPSERYVYLPFSLYGSNFVFSAGKDKQKAMEEADSIYKRKIKIVQREKRREKAILNNSPRLKFRDEEIETAFICAKNSLSRLTNYTGSVLELRFRMYAGLPWFFQFWSRDNLISLKAAKEECILRASCVKTIIFDMLSLARKTGAIPRLLPPIKKKTGESGESSDSLGWLFVRINEMLSKGEFHFLERAELKRYTKNVIRKVLYYQTHNGLAHSGPYTSWMDSLERNGATIEAQALRLNLYNTAYKLTGNSSYAELESQLKGKVKKHFWKDGVLADIKGDFTIRSNIFLAAYIYPSLLEKEEWIECFDNILPRLWLRWGGIASIDKKDERFTPDHTGENPASYHQGDSWFFVNNLAALVLYQTDPDKYSKYIERILKASTKEILKQGVAGAHAEVSSARKLRSQGCLNQAWSNAMYIELIREIYNS